MGRLLDISAPLYHVQSTAKQLRDGFPDFEHHESISKLRSKKWRRACAHSIYPFTHGGIDDFDPAFAGLVPLSGDRPDLLYRPDDYAGPFLPVGDRLVSQAEEALSCSRPDEARSLFLRAAAVFRIDSFPTSRSELGQEAWRRGRRPMRRPGDSWARLACRSRSGSITRTPLGATRRSRSRPTCAFRMAFAPRAGGRAAVHLRLDAYRTDHTARTQEHVDRGVATLSFEIPGTGDWPNNPEIEIFY